MTEELKNIILTKCGERDRLGYDHLTDSDIMGILEECHNRNIPVTRKELEQLAED